MTILEYRCHNAFELAVTSTGIGKGSIIRVDTQIMKSLPHLVQK